MPFSDPEERNAYVDMVAQAVVDKIEERDRINGLADLVFARVLDLQQKQAALDAAPFLGKTYPQSRRAIMSKNPASSPAAPEELSDARQKFEAETVTRRAALRKFGITSGMAVFGMFAADDLARMVIKKMEDNEATRQIAETVAHEFKNAGIAFADPPAGCVDTPTAPGVPGNGGSCNVSAIGTACANQYPGDSVGCSKCVTLICYQCACGNSTGVPCNSAACNSYCYTTAVGACSSS